MVSVDNSTTVPPEAVDFARLSDWMDREGLPRGPVVNVRPLDGGTQNIMVRFERGGRTYVLRRPPIHKRKNSDDAIRREAVLLRALSKTPVRHPKYIAGSSETDTLGAAFYLMDYVPGFNPAGGMPPLHAGSPDVRRQMGFSMIDALAELGAVDYRECGLDGFGKPEGFLERQAGRWKADLDSYVYPSGYTGSRLPDVDALARWLESNVPRSWTPGIIHGDYHVANVRFSETSPDVTAIVDWEMATLGDPLLDLGWLIATYPENGFTMLTPEVSWTGFPAPRELVERYAARSSRDLARIDWYTALACYKLGIILEGTHVRALHGKAPVETGQRLHAIAVDLLRRAARITGGG